MEYEHIIHPFAPVYDHDSRILILGSLPSVKSRENDFYYGHPQNRFWKVLAAVFGEVPPVTIEEKKRFLARHGIALWDVIAECEIAGSSDASIRNVKPNELGRILEEADIQKIFTNGNKAYELFQRYCLPVCGREAHRLPSTSPANAAYNLDRLAAEWNSITQI